ncbi:MAG TPA: SpoIIE family protein phosphatase [Anaerolineae bacterium]|nr:SpoIIE family protein phosphatase [Anaerolineae bacterium]
MLIIPLISGIFAYSSISRVENLNAQIFQAIELELRVDRLADDFSDVEIFVHRYLATGNRQEFANFEKARDRLERDIKGLAEVIPKTDKELVSTIEDRTESVGNLSTQIFSIQDPVQNPDAQALLLEFDRIADETIGELFDFREDIESSIVAMLSRAVSEQRNLNRRLLIAFLFLVLGPLVFWIAGRNISQPIYNLVRQAKRLSAGSWDEEVPYQQGVEVGILSDTMEEMRKNLVDYRTTLKNEVDILQTAILPHEVPEIEGLEAATFYFSSTEGLLVGGDFYDFIPLLSGECGLVVGDISGRGIEAAARTALARFSLRSFALENPEPAKVLERSNKALFPQITLGNFITIWYGVWNPVSKTIVYSNAGHPYPILARASSKTVEELYDSGMAVGMLENAKYENREVKLEPGDILLLYTDGLTEARSKAGEFLGDERLMDLVRDLMGKGAKTIAQSIGSFCLDWAAGKLGDDVAVVVLRVLNA